MYTLFTMYLHIKRHVDLLRSLSPNSLCPYPCNLQHGFSSKFQWGVITIVITFSIRVGSGPTPHQGCGTWNLRCLSGQWCTRRVWTGWFEYWRRGRSSTGSGSTRVEFGRGAVRRAAGRQ